MSTLLSLCLRVGTAGPGTTQMSGLNAGGQLRVNDFRRAAHPAFRPDGLRPISKLWDEAEVLPDVLLANPPGRDDSAGGERYHGAKNTFGHEDALGVMAKCAMPKVRSDLLRFVEPVVDEKIVINRAAPLIDAGE